MNLNCLLFALFLGFGLLVLLYAFFAHFFIKPIKLLSIYAGKIASGDFSQKIYSHPKGELGVLSCSLQNLAKKIKGSVKEVDVNTNRLEAVLLSMFDGVLVTDASGNIVLINQSLKELLQITSPPEGKLPLEIIRNLEVQDIVEKTLQRKGFEKREVVLRLPEETNFIIHATPIMRAQKCDGVVLVFHNITELRKLETIRRDFVANASHELRTPIANIQGYSETLLEGAIGDKQNARRFLEVINSESKRVGQLIADLLDLSKMESGKLMVSPKPCDLALIIHNITEQFSKQALAKTISLKADFSPEMPFVFADENSLRQILVNLIDNSIKYQIFENI